MKQGSKLERDPQKLALQLDQLHELNSDQLREQRQTLFGTLPPPKTPIVAASSWYWLSAS